MAPKLDMILEWAVLILLAFTQIVMNFVVYFTESLAYTMTVNIVNACLVLCYILQVVRFYHRSDIPHKCTYFIKVNMNFMPNYILGALVIYIYSQASYLDNQTNLWISYGTLRFVFQVLNYSFFVQKEFMNRQVYFVAQTSVTVWVCFLTQGTVEAILKERPTDIDVLQQGLALASLGINMGIAIQIMGDLKNEFNNWMDEYWRVRREVEQMLTGLIAGEGEQTSGDGPESPESPEKSLGTRFLEFALGDK
jgi:hypothetical protein